MAEKVLKTRIQLKYDTLQNWTTNDPVLKIGELAIATIDAASPANKQLPPVMFRVGDGTHTFSELDWASGLAADVYGWAKAKTKPSYTAAEVGADVAGAAATAEANAKAYVDEQIGAIPPAAEYTLETGATDGSLVLKKDGVAVGDPAVVKGWAELLTSIGEKYTKPEGGIPKSDLATDVQTSLGKADSSIQSVSLAGGTNNGTLKLTVDGTAKDNIAVTGLGSAAYTESSAYATAAQGTKADNAMPKAGGAFTGAITVQAPTAEMNPATKQYVDTAINTVKQFEYQVVTELPTASQATMGKIYLKAHSHNPSDGQPDSYDEFITVLSGSTYKWERIGNTDIDLSGYVPTTRKINGKALTSDITLGAADVGVNETAFPGLNKVGTVTGVKMNAGSAISPDASGVIDLGTVITDISGKQDKLTPNQLLAVDSGITADKVGQYDGYATGKQDKIDAAHKLSADLVDGLGAAAKKGVASSVTAAGVDLPTAAAVASYVGAEIGKISIPTVNNAALKDASGATIFTANASADVEITVIDCGNASGWDA